MQLVSHNDVNLLLRTFIRTVCYQRNDDVVFLLDFLPPSVSKITGLLGFSNIYMDAANFIVSKNEKMSIATN